MKSSFLIWKFWLSIINININIHSNHCQRRTRLYLLFHFHLRIQEMSKTPSLLFLFLLILDSAASKNFHQEEAEDKCLTKLLGKLLPAMKLYKKIISKLEKMRDTVEFWKIIFYVIETPTAEQLSKYPGILAARPSPEFAKSLLEEVPNAVILWTGIQI